MSSRLSSDVVADSCVDVNDMQESLRRLNIDEYNVKNAGLVARADLAIDPRLQMRPRLGVSDSGTTQSIITTSIDSAYGDSITSSINSIRSNLDSIWNGKISSLLESVPENEIKDNVIDKTGCNIDEGIEDHEEILPTHVEFEEAVPVESVDGRLRQNQDGDTILHLSIICMVAEDTFNIISNIICRQHLDIENHMMQTPLILAALTRQTNIVRRLIIVGADIEKTDRHGDTALHVACRHGDLAMVRSITTQVSPGEIERHPTKYEVSLQAVPQDLNKRNYEGYTPFHLATIGGHLEVLSYLHQLKADVDAQDGRNGKRALHIAVERNDERTICHLVDKCAADIDATTFYNLSPVMLASDKRLHRIVEYLVQSGADHSDLDCSEVEDDEYSSEDIEMFDDFKINGEPIHT